MVLSWQCQPQYIYEKLILSCYLDFRVKRDGHPRSITLIVLPLNILNRETKKTILSHLKFEHEGLPLAIHWQYSAFQVSVESNYAIALVLHCYGL